LSRWVGPAQPGLMAAFKTHSHEPAQRHQLMATQPDIPAPDTITPQSPQEAPPMTTPPETPVEDPPGIVPPSPDRDRPDVGVPETPPPPD